MKKISEGQRRQRILYCGVLLVFVIAAPVITFLWGMQNTADNTELVVGYVLSAIFASCLLLFLLLESFREKAVYILYGIFILSTLATLYLSYIDHFSLEHSLLFIMLLFGISILIPRPVLLLPYYLITLILLSAMLYSIGETYIRKDVLLLTFLLFCIISNLNAWIKYVEYKKSMKNEEQFGLLVEQMQEGLAIHEIILDEKGIPVDYRFLSVNDSFERLTGLVKKDIINKRVLEVLPKTERYWIDLYGKVALTGVPNHYENYSVELDRYFSVTAFSPKKNQFAVMITDISEDKRKQKEIEFLSFHDQLTGIYNRRFYENAVRELDQEDDLPLAMVMIDVNGLKLTNDAFGHKAGDNLLQKTADILAAKCRPDDIAARIGGDEFILLLPRTDLEQARSIIHGITDVIAHEKIDNILLSVSIGCSVKNCVSENLMDVFKKAEDEMYRHKLSESSSMRSKTIDLIMNTLFEKNTREMLHSKRVSKICETIAESMGFDKDAVSQMRIAGLMHDIGKIGLYENILTKTEELNTSEWDEIERHSEVGYRILSSLNEFSEIADYVLEHHEHWDGHGYPRGLKAGEISLQARIISIADAFDAMTSDRTYRMALSEEDAVHEIVKCSGTQFDPAIARIFVEKVLRREWDHTVVAK